jgi:hypothetical protein
MSIVLSQGAFCVSARERQYRKNNKAMYIGISVNLGKL